MTYFVPNQSEISSNDAYLYATGIVLTSVFMVVTFHSLVFHMFQTACKLRLGCAGLIYRKSLRLLRSTAEDGINGKVINLLSNDVSKIEPGLTYLYDSWKGPVEALVFGIIIYMKIGVSAVIGMAFLASFIPLQGKHRFFHLTGRE